MIGFQLLAREARRKAVSPLYGLIGNESRLSRWPHWFCGSPAYGLTVNGVSFEPAAPQLVLSVAATEPTLVLSLVLPGL